jgi:hypothetical protein
MKIKILCFSFFFFNTCSPAVQKELAAQHVPPLAFQFMSGPAAAFNSAARQRLAEAVAADGLPLCPSLNLGLGQEFAAPPGPYSARHGVLQSRPLIIIERPSFIFG